MFYWSFYSCKLRQAGAQHRQFDSFTFACAVATKTKLFSPSQRKNFFWPQNERGGGKVADDDHREAEDAEVDVGGLEGSHHQGEVEEEARARADTGSKQITKHAFTP